MMAASVVCTHSGNQQKNTRESAAVVGRQQCLPAQHAAVHTCIWGAAALCAGCASSKAVHDRSAATKESSGGSGARARTSCRLRGTAVPGSASAALGADGGHAHAQTPHRHRGTAQTHTRAHACTHTRTRAQARTRTAPQPGADTPNGHPPTGQPSQQRSQGCGGRKKLVNSNEAGLPFRSRGPCTLHAAHTDHSLTLRHSPTAHASGPHDTVRGTHCLCLGELQRKRTTRARTPKHTQRAAPPTHTHAPWRPSVQHASC
jgi:hypothetical protein